MSPSSFGFALGYSYLWLFSLIRTFALFGCLFVTLAELNLFVTLAELNLFVTLASPKLLSLGKTKKNKLFFGFSLA